MEHQVYTRELLNRLDKQQLKSLSIDIRNEIINVTSKNGGHLSSNLGVVDLTISLLKCFDIDKDKILFDVGHQVYAYKLLTGRNLSTLRQKDGIAPFQKYSESKYDYFEAGHSSTSLSAALGLAISRDEKKENYDIISVIGDGSIVNGMALEALNNIGHLKEHKIIIILNDNGMSISKPIGGINRAFAKLRETKLYHVSTKKYRDILTKTKIGSNIFYYTKGIKDKIKRFILPDNLFENFGIKYYGIVDGHNFKALDKALKYAKRQNESTIIHVHTKKGKGYKFAEEDETGYWHGVTPFNVETGNPINMHEGKFSFSHITADILEKKMAEDPLLNIICPATTKGSSLDHIFALYPNRCFDVGISEEHGLTFSSGMFLGGLHPVVSIYSTFFQRAFDQFSHDVARIKAKELIILDRAGLIGADGETHQGIYDVPFLINTPNCMVSTAFDFASLKQLIDLQRLYNGPFIVRIPREFLSPNDNSYCFKLGDIVAINKNNGHIAFIGTGHNGLLVAQNQIDGVDTFISPFQNNFNEDSLKQFLNYNSIVIYDSYSLETGFCLLLDKSLRNIGYQGTIITYGIPTQFIQFASIEEQLEQLNLDVTCMVTKLSHLN